MGIFITNDTAHAWLGEVKWSLQSLQGDVLQQGVLAVNAVPLATTPVKTLDFASRVNADNRRDVVLVCELRQNDVRVALNTTLFVPDKHARLLDPQIAVQLESHEGQLCVQLHAQSLARFVEVALDGADVIFSDNYFDLPAQTEMTITASLPEGWSIDRARQALRVRSLRDSY
jgi:beta-mannosidase